MKKSKYAKREKIVGYFPAFLAEESGLKVQVRLEFG